MSQTHSGLNLLFKKMPLSVFFPPPFHLHHIFCNTYLLIYIQLLSYYLLLVSYFTYLKLPHFNFISGCGFLVALFFLYWGIVYFWCLVNDF